MKNPWAIFFEFLMERSSVFKFVLGDDGGLSKAHIRRHSIPPPLVCVVTSMVANRAPPVPILSQFPIGFMSVNLAFQLSDTTLKSSYSTIIIFATGPSTSVCHSCQWLWSHEKRGWYSQTFELSAPLAALPKGLSRGIFAKNVPPV